MIETTLVQRLIPAAAHGRAFRARTTLTGAAVALGGVFLQCLPASGVIGLAAQGCAATGAVGLLVPTLRRLGRQGAV